MEKLFSIIGILFVASLIFNFDLKSYFKLPQLPNFGLPGGQQTQVQQQPEGQVPQVPQIPQVSSPQVPQTIATPSPSPSPDKNPWGIGFKGEIKTPFGSTKNEATLGNSDFIENDNEGSE